jgi:hypothetical protein
MTAAFGLEKKLAMMHARRLSRYVVDQSTGCWLWTGATTDEGYGKIEARAAHRYFYLSLVGPIPEGMILCHKCDTPPCVNPDHLFVGTPLDNALDKMAKGRNRIEGNIPRPRRRVDMSCEVCCVRFSAAARDVTRGGGKYCSVKCRSQVKKPFQGRWPAKDKTA